MEIYKSFSFDAAHRLIHVPPGHRCSRLHGHTFTVDIFVSGEAGEDTGWIMDFAEIKKAFQPLYEQLDHSYLNELEGLKNPTSENIARWIWVRLKDRLPGLSRIAVKETDTSGCIYRGE